MPARRTSLSATLNGTAVNQILSASCTYGLDMNVPQATVYVAADPSPGTPLYNAELVLTMGAGNNIVRFRGLFRRYDYTLYPRAIGLVGLGYLTRVQEYQNHETGAAVDGLVPLDLVGSETFTDADIVRAALDRTSVAHYSSGDIGGTGVTWGSRAKPPTFLWRAGTSSNPLVPLYGAGESALDYIQAWDKVSAVYTNDTSPVGFYRTYETVNGIFRSLIGGRPRGTVDLTFTEGINIAVGSTSSREFPIANAAFVTGFDPGLGIGPVRNIDDSGAFLGQSSNPYQPSGRSVTYEFSSPFIEWSNEAEAGIGMNAERLANALLADLNRETVTVRLTTPVDDYIAPGMTILVQGPGGAPDRLGVGENLWVNNVTATVGEDGAFQQTIVAIGGGLPDDYTPAPAG